MSESDCDIEVGSDNIYADLGYKGAGAMLVKARLASQIDAIIKDRKLTQTQAAKLVGLSQPKLSGLLRGQFRGVSETKMLDCLARLGRDIQIVVGPARRSRDSGTVTVVLS